MTSGSPTTQSSPSKRAKRDPNQTPAMRQFARFKAKHPDCVLFFRMGDFYEMFHDDALLAHRVLGITLTERTEGVPMAGVPYHAVESYLRQMIEQGYRVAVCDQVQDAKEAKGIVERAVTRVLTPGTLVDETLLEASRPNLIAALQFLGSGDASDAAIAIAELSTGSLRLMDLPAARVIDELTRLEPTELIHVETADGALPARLERIRKAIGCVLTARPAWMFRRSESIEVLHERYQVSTLAGFGLEEDDPALGPTGALLRYLIETQCPDDASGEALRHLRPPRRESPQQYLAIDAVSLRSLEIERTMRSGQTEGSLVAVLQRCRSAMGKRLLRQWLCFPRRDRRRIESRQDAVAAFLAEQALREDVREEIGHVQDVARIVGRVSLRRATPRDLAALGGSVARLRRLVELLEGVASLAPQHEALQRVAEDLLPLADTIRASCVDHPPAHLREGGLFRDGVDEQLDDARTLTRDGNTWLAAYQKRLIEQTDIPSLKVGYNKVFGYYIEVTHTHVAKIPASFTRKQTLKNAERYITEELKTFEDKITTAEARAIEREQMLFERLCKRAAGAAAALAAYAETIAELDVLACFADLSQRYRYCRPAMVDEPVLDIRQGRHPVLDRMLGAQFVPNDTTLKTSRSDAEGGAAGQPASLALITGPNMAGKSTYIRQVALIVLLAHTGCYVPAEAATIGLTDRIFTRIGASDELHAGQSTFMVEMTETANILHHASASSLVILDEIGRGTSTLDGLSLAWAIAETLARVGCRTLFATHYHELTSLAERIDAITNLNVAVREWGDEVIFLHRILPGRTDRSYGIHVARIAGLPSETIHRAGELLESLAVQTEATSAAKIDPPVTSAGAQLGLFTEYVPHPVVDELRTVKLEALSPLEAFDTLRRLVERAARDADH